VNAKQTDSPGVAPTSRRRVTIRMAASVDSRMPAACFPPDGPEAVAVHAEIDAIFSACRALLFVLDHKGRIVRVSDSAARACSQAADTLIGRVIWDELMPETEGREFQRKFRSLCSTGKALNCESHLLSGEGTERVVLWSGATAGTDSDDASQVVLSGLDITIRRQFEEQAITRERRLQALLEFNYMGSRPLPQVYDYVLEQAIRLTGSEIGFIALIDHEQQKLTIPSWTSVCSRKKDGLTHPLVCTIAEAGAWADTVRTGEPAIVNDTDDPAGEYPGGYNDVGRRVSVPVYEENRLVAVIGVAQKASDYDGSDVNWLQHLMERLLTHAESHLDRQKLEQSERRWRLLIETMSDGLVIFDETFRVLYANRRLGQLLCYDPGELVGKPIELLLNEADQSTFQERMAEQTDREPSQYEAQWRASDGHWVPTIMSPQPMLDNAGNFIGSFAVLTDITYQKQTERRLQEANERLEAEQAAMSEKNIALKEVLSQIEQEKEQIKRQVQSNVDRILSPLLRTVKEKADENLGTYMRLLEDCLDEISAPFVNSLERKFASLSPREIEICNMIKSGLSSKQIAETLNTSPHTVHNQRKQIRRKLGLTDREVNLRSYLQTL